MIAEFDPNAGQRRESVDVEYMLVAVEGDRVVGYVAWKPDGFVEFDYITFLYVSPTYRRRGLATQLFDAALSKIDHHRVFTSTQPDNPIMLGLLSSRGWKEAGTVRMANEDDTSEIFFFKEHQR